LELVYLLLSKSTDDVVQQVATAVFKPLYEDRLNNEESEKCRIVACEVLKEIFKRSDAERTNSFLSLLRTGIRSDDEDIVRVSLQTFRLYYDSNASQDGDIPLLMDRISSIGKSAEDPGSDMGQIFEALLLSNSLAEKFSEILFSRSTSQSFWTIMRACLSYPHEWVKLSASKLFNSYFADFARTNADTDLKLPLKGSGGLKLTGEDIQDLIRRTTYSFNTPAFSNPATPELIKNLVFLARCAGANDLKWRSWQAAEDEDEDEEDDSEKDSRTALHFLLRRLSSLLRKEISPPRLPTLLPRTNGLTLLQSLILTPPPTTLLPSLQLIIAPLHHITDPNIPTPYSTDESFRTAYEDMKSSAEALLESVKRKVGIEKYSEALLEVGRTVKKNREERRAKRKIDAVSRPEQAGKEKARKTERKKERRKEKGAEYKSKRHEQ